MKKLLITFGILLSLPVFAFALTPSPTGMLRNSSNGLFHVSPLIPTDALQADHFTATSTTATSTFAYGLNLTGGCVAVNSTCLGGGSMVYPGAGIGVSTGSAWTTSLTAPSGAIVGISDTQTLTNKRITKRVQTASDGVSISVNADSYDTTNQTNTQAAGTLTLNNPTGSPTDWQSLCYAIKATNAQTMAYGNLFDGGTVGLTATLTGGGKEDDLCFKYSALTSTWNETGAGFGY